MPAAWKRYVDTKIAIQHARTRLDDLRASPGGADATECRQELLDHLQCVEQGARQLEAFGAERVEQAAESSSQGGE